MAIIKAFINVFKGVVPGFVGGLILLLSGPGTVGLAGDLSWVSSPSSGFIPASSSDNDSCFPIISSDGRYILFGSTADNLAVASGNLPYRPGHVINRNVFLYDRVLVTNMLVSLDVTGTMGGSDHSTPVALSTNGQYALFESEATNLVAGGSNPRGDVFRRDLSNQATVLVSAATNGAVGNGASTDSTMTQDGRYVAFSSFASNLVADDTNGIGDVFVRDLQNGSLTLVSAGAQAMALNAAYRFNAAYSGVSGSDLPEITPDGRYVAFLSTATNLVAGGTNPGEVYVRDLVGKVTYCVSAYADKSFVNRACYSHRISADGQFVAFEAISVTSSKPGLIVRHNVQSGVDDLVSTNAALPGDYYQNVQSLDMTPDGRFITFVGNTNATSSSSIMVWDAQTATATTVCPGNKGAVCDSPRIDPTGRYVSFRTTATNVVANAVIPGSKHLYLSDLQASTTQLVDVTTNGTGSAGEFISNQGMDASGRFVVFDSTGSDLATNDSNESADVFVRDTVAGTTALVSARHPVLASQTSLPTRISSQYNTSADGRYLVFAANGSGLAPEYTNRNRGIFVRDLVAGTNQLVSVSTNGIGDANGWSTYPIISGNGRYVAFASRANNLVDNDTNAGADVFLSDLQTGTTELISVGTINYEDYNYTPDFIPYAISFDGRYVLFAGGFTGAGYLRDTLAGVTYNIATYLEFAAMTPDGRYVAFGGIPRNESIFSPAMLCVWDSQAAQLVYSNANTYAGNVAITTDGQNLAYGGGFPEPSLHLLNWSSNDDKIIAPLGGWASYGQLSFSSDGRYLAYDAQGPNVPGVTNRLINVFLYDCQTGSNRLVSARYYSANGAHGNSYRPSISADGRYVVYESTADDLVPGTPQRKQIYLFNRVTATTTLLSYSALNSAPGNFISEAPVFTGDGQTVVFQSFASDLVTNDFNLVGGLFMVQLSPTNAVSTSTNSSLVQVSQLVYSSGTAGLAGSGPTLTWPAASSLSYQVWYKDNFSDPAWQPLNGSITIQGQQAQAVDFTPNTSQRFYKIVGN